MVFSSLLFLFFFLPLVILIHTLLPERWRNPFLLAASLLFYAVGDWRNLPLILGMTLLDFAACRLMARLEGGKKKAVLAGTVIINALVLVIFKYLKLLVPGLPAYPALPLGISFFIFQSISCVVDVYRGTVPAEKSPLDFATYLLLFPQLIAGPIVRYSDVQEALHQRRGDAAQLEQGMRQFLTGLALKVLLANRLGGLYDQLAALTGRGSLATLFMVGSSSLQYYYDFFGYSLMAIGIGRMLGFTFPVNFNHPFCAVSIREIWSRWHITLGTWLKSYVYIPLGGSRKGQARQALNLIAVWALSGLWHGATWFFLAWGLYFCFFILMERFVWGKWLERHRAVGHVYTIAVFVFSSAIFIQEDAAGLAAFCGELFTPTLAPQLPFLLLSSLLPLLMAVLLCSPRIYDGLDGFLKGHRLLGGAAYLGLFVLCVLSLVRSSYNPFLYFRF